MKNLLTLLILISIIAFPQWRIQDTSTTAFLNEIAFVDDINGFIVGSGGTIFRSTDAGSSWNLLAAPVTADLRSISALETGHIYVAGDQGVILYSDDNGENWLDRGPEYFAEIRAVDFIDSLEGWAAGTDSLFHTTDGGASWELILNEENTYFGDILFVNSDTGFYACEKHTSSATYEYRISKTTDAGLNWQVVYQAESEAMYADLFFVNELTGYAAGDNDILLRTTDGGENWTNLDFINSPGLPFYTSVHFINETGWVSTLYSYPEIYKTNTAGTFWEPAISDDFNFSIRLFDIYFTDTLNGWAAGVYFGDSTRSLIMQTTDGGTVFIDESSSEMPGDLTLSQNYPNPFNPVTRIDFSLPEEGYAELVVYDILGNEAAQLISGNLPAGNYSAKFDGSDFAAGIYFYRLSSVNKTITKKFILLK